MLKKLLKQGWHKIVITSDPYFGVVPMFSYIDSIIMAPHHSRDQR